MTTAPVRTTGGFLKPQALRDGYVEQAIWREGTTVHNVTLHLDTASGMYIVRHSSRVEPAGTPATLEQRFDELRKARKVFRTESRH